MKLLLACQREHVGVVTHLQVLGKLFPSKLIFLEDQYPYFFPGRKNLMGKVISKIVKRLSKPNVQFLAGHGESIILGGWGRLHAMLVDQLNGIGIRPTVLWASSLGQTDMVTHEVGWLRELLSLARRGKIFRLFLGRKQYDAVSHAPGTMLLPHPIDTGLIARKDPKTQLRGRNVDLFCALRPGKNVLNQMLATALLEKHVHLHVNFDQPDLMSIVKASGLDLSCHRWLPQEEYYSLISSMDMSLQVTYTESFNYAVAERMCLGVPPLATPDIYVLASSRFLRKYLCVETPDSPTKIAEKMDLVLSDRRLRSQLADCCRSTVADTAAKENAIVTAVLSDLFD